MGPIAMCQLECVNCNLFKECNVDIFSQSGLRSFCSLTPTKMCPSPEKNNGRWKNKISTPFKLNAIIFCLRIRSIAWTAGRILMFKVVGEYMYVDIVVWMEII